MFQHLVVHKALEEEWNVLPESTKALLKLSSTLSDIPEDNLLTIDVH
jgi:hypothetical protein